MPTLDPEGPITLEQSEQQRVEAAHRREDHRQSWGIRSLIGGLIFGGLVVLLAAGWWSEHPHPDDAGPHTHDVQWVVVIALLGTALTAVNHGLTEWLTRPARESAMNGETRGRQIERTQVEIIAWLERIEAVLAKVPDYGNAVLDGMEMVAGRRPIPQGRTNPDNR